MLEVGLIGEARAFYESNSDGTARQAIGCKELVPYFAGEITLEEAVENVKRATRRYAKRQLTWFNRMDGIKKIYIDDCTDADGVLEAAAEIVENSGILL